MADFLKQCMDDLAPQVGENQNVNQFNEFYCKRCRQPECERAQWSRDNFAQRVATQAERMLHPQNQIRVTDTPKYAMLTDFVDMAREAVRLEISDRRGDWNVPEDRHPLQVIQPAEMILNPAEPPELPEEEPPEPPKEEPLPPIPEPVLPHPPTGNTQAPPAEGIMIGGLPIPSKPLPVQDTWEIKPVVQTVAPGARIKLGGK